MADEYFLGWLNKIDNFKPYTKDCGLVDEYGRFVPGTIIKTEKNLYLVGNVNEVLGVCDDCNVKDEQIIEISHINWILTNDLM